MFSVKINGVSFTVLSSREAADNADALERETLWSLPLGLVAIAPRDRARLYQVSNIESWCAFDWAVPQSWFEEHPGENAVWAYPHGGFIFGFPVFDRDVIAWVKGLLSVAVIESKEWQYLVNLLGKFDLAAHSLAELGALVEKTET